MVNLAHFQAIRRWADSVQGQFNDWDSRSKPVQESLRATATHGLVRRPTLPCLLQLRGLRLGLVEDGDVGVGGFP